MTLRVTVDHHPDETRVSLLSRLAIANGYRSLQVFLSLNGTSVLPFERGEPQAIKKLSDWSGVDIARLQSFDIRGNGQGATWELGAARMSKDMRIGNNHRYCPKCVVNDLADGARRPNTRPYVRAVWMTRAVHSCVTHHCSIVEVSEDDGNRDDFARYVEKNLELIKLQASATTEKDVALAQYVTARIESEPANEFLDQFDTYVAVDLCRHLGDFSARHRSINDTTSQTPATSEIDLGFKIASAGPERIEALISDAVKRERPLALEIQSFFGKLRRWLLRNKGKEEFISVVELFQDIVERHIPIGQDELFVLPTRQRYLHSVRSASTEYGMPDERVLQLVLDAGLTERSDLTSGRIYFDAIKGHRTLSSALHALTSTEIAAELGVHIDRMRPLFEANLIPRVKATENGWRVFSRVMRSDFDAFKKRLDVADANPIEQATLVPIVKAAQITFSSLSDILGLVFADKLGSLRRLNRDGVISGLGLDLDELTAASLSLQKNSALTELPLYDPTDPTPSLMTTAQARQYLATADGTVRELSRLNYVKLVKGFNPKTKRTNSYICANSIKSFMAEHISLAHLAENRRMFAVTVRDKLKEIGVKSIFEPTGRNSRYYLKSDVFDLDLTK